MDKKSGVVEFSGDICHADFVESLQSNILKSVSSEFGSMTNRAYGFTIAGFNFLIEPALYCELLTNIKISSLPNAPSHFLGLTNVRGNLVPVYMLENLIENQRAPVKVSAALMFDQPAHGGALAIGHKPMPVDMREFQILDGGVSELPEVLRPVVDISYTQKKLTWYQVNHRVLFKYLAQLQ